VGWGLAGGAGGAEGRCVVTDKVFAGLALAHERGQCRVDGRDADPRTPHEAERDGLIRVEGKEVLLVDIEALRAIAEA